MNHLHIYWARRDFRLGDNPALTAAITESRKNGEFLPVFVLDFKILNSDNIGLPRRFGLAEILGRFTEHFERFLILDGSDKSLSEVFSYFKVKADAVTIYANEDIEPYARTRDVGLAKHFDLKLYRDALTISKETKTGTAKIYSVFTPFKKNVWDQFINANALKKPDLKNLTYSTLTPDHTLHKGFSKKIVQDLRKDLSNDWNCTVGNKTYDISGWCTEPDFQKWVLTEEQAIEHATAYSEDFISNYSESRNIVAEDGTSRVSMALKWGLVSARQLKDLVLKHHHQDTVSVYISELIWREFYRYILFHSPHVLDLEYQEKYRSIIWDEDERACEFFEKWMKGETGYPIVDAAMRQLNQTGWMHNRSRMIVGSFLTKHLGIDWRWGQNYFRSTLLDLDEASNNGGWQWSASVGADPKPIRIFNPYIQEEKFDPDGTYRKQWLPEDYNFKPIVDHPEAREMAKARYKKYII